MRVIIGKIDVPEEKSEMVRTFLNHIELDDYDLLIQLCDAIALPEGPVSMEKDFVISKKDMAVIPKTNDRDANELKAYFERKDGKNSPQRINLFIKGLMNFWKKRIF